MDDVHEDIISDPEDIVPDTNNTPPKATDTLATGIRTAKRPMYVQSNQRTQKYSFNTEEGQGGADLPEEERTCVEQVSDTAPAQTIEDTDKHGEGSKKGESASGDSLRQVLERVAELESENAALKQKATEAAQDAETARNQLKEEREARRVVDIKMLQKEAAIAGERNERKRTKRKVAGPRRYVTAHGGVASRHKQLPDQKQAHTKRYADANKALAEQRQTFKQEITALSESLDSEREQSRVHLQASRKAVSELKHKEKRERERNESRERWLLERGAKVCKCGDEACKSLAWWLQEKDCELDAAERTNRIQQEAIDTSRELYDEHMLQAQANTEAAQQTAKLAYQERNFEARRCRDLLGLQKIVKDKAHADEVDNDRNMCTAVDVLQEAREAANRFKGMADLSQMTAKAHFNSLQVKEREIADLKGKAYGRGPQPGLREWMPLTPPETPSSAASSLDDIYGLDSRMSDAPASSSPPGATQMTGKSQRELSHVMGNSSLSKRSYNKARPIRSVETSAKIRSVDDKERLLELACEDCLHRLAEAKGYDERSIEPMDGVSYRESFSRSQTRSEPSPG
ncbi:hypothetical protein LTR85_006771 [Meristemomyces frigidus]|nr:hypothetical protein LTR85_006771 [Meristemomyces frigidus]